jgi:putative membrane protein
MGGPDDLPAGGAPHDDRQPYADLCPEDLILRDHLALDRTIMANERTLLAYIRTALALLVIGASVVKFYDSPAYLFLGWLFLILGLVTPIIGVVRYQQLLNMIRRAQRGKSSRPE